MSKETEKTVTSQEAADILGISYPTFRRRVGKEIVPVNPQSSALKKPQGERFRLSDVEALRKPQS